MGSLKLTTASSGSVILSPANTASDVTITVPAQTATMATLTTPSFASTIGVGGATAASSGAGITFPATQSASSDANTLDDYEEGTFTPTLLFGTNAHDGSYSYQYGSYVKIGKLVFVQGIVGISSAGTRTGTAMISNLPFTAYNQSGGCGAAAGLYNGMTGLGGCITLDGPSNSVFTTLYTTSSTGVSQVTKSNFTTTSNFIQFSFCYPSVS